MIMMNAAYDTTAHGIPNILGSTPWLFKIMWMVCLLASCGCCGYLLVKSVIDYLGYEVVTTICKVPDSPALFPTITLCNANLISNQNALNYV
jgi:hypothetical protein